jgi:hypothetical protein
MKWWICGNEMEMEEYMDSEMEMETFKTDRLFRPNFVTDYFVSKFVHTL